MPILAMLVRNRIAAGYKFLAIIRANRLSVLVHHMLCQFADRKSDVASASSFNPFVKIFNCKVLKILTLVVPGLGFLQPWQFHCHFFEHVFDIVAYFGTGLDEYSTNFFGFCFSFLGSHLPFILQIGFVTDQYYNDLIIPFTLDIVYPVTCIQKWLSIWNKWVSWLRPGLFVNSLLRQRARNRWNLERGRKSNHGMIPWLTRYQRRNIQKPSLRWK